MRPFGLALAAAAMIGCALVGLRAAPGVHALLRPPTAASRPLVASAIDADSVTTVEPNAREVVYCVPLPAWVRDGDRVELRFRDALDGARVDAAGSGPQTYATLLHRRVGGDTVAIPLPPGRTDAVHVRIHHNFRPAPLVRGIVVVAPATAAIAGPPSAASPRSTR